MEVESEDEDDRRDNRNEGHSALPDQDTQLQDMDEVRVEELYMFLPVKYLVWSWLYQVHNFMLSYIVTTRVWSLLMCVHQR